ncbi:MAG: D-2-hydroxyacid dehydrogenase [Chloroflexi bacterium]|nr:D-2-hydroxyacid dehydrogenase [Chloroflexota bacterium]
MAAKTVVVGFEPDAGLVERIEAVLSDGDAEVIVAGTDEELEAVIGKADVLFGGVLSPDMIGKAGRLKWFQTNSAGVENVASPELADSGITVTNMSGAHATQISEHVLAMMLAFARDLPRAVRAQDDRNWIGTNVNTCELDGSVIAIAGLGDLGGALADKAKALGMTVLATKMRVTTKPVSVDEVYGPEGLDEIIGRADFVADTLPLTPNSRHTFARDQFRRMKPSAYFFNVGRGGTVNQDDLIDALQSGEIAGAGLDVMEPEPLPADSPLWDMHNVILTYHSSGTSPKVYERHYQIFLDNLDRFEQGWPLANVVNVRAGY